MQRIFAIALTAACVVGAAAPAFARNAGHAGPVSDPTVLLAPSPAMPALENRIPAPLPEPAQAPTINGPLSQPAFRGLTGIGQ